ncbi:olfactory receptor 10R2-like [Nothobranchius furzeri]|uniref:olfactory receptor 10R2-like n=1 Tax=Nothobranchius furzeri TaxID=105023 RepID=UPI00077D6627|nr:olfactory receptor 10R2-like [Nothobranchius furzeri]
MMNSTQVSYFILSDYIDAKLLKYFIFVLLFFVYVLIVGCNVLLIVVICVNRTLHEPMYMFLCSLFVNELYGSTGLFPFLLIQLLSDVHTISAPLCFLQIFCVCTYGAVEFSNLTIMSYDRYMAICYPLHYYTQITKTKAGVCIAAAWVTSFLLVVTTTSMSFSLQLCGNIMNRVYCNNYSVVKLACSDTTVNNIYGLIISALGLFVPVVLIIYTYMRILKVCFSGSKQTRQKAVSTCTPHLASLLNYTFGFCFDVIQSRFDMSGVPNVVRIFLSLYFLTCQPLLNPLMYGLHLSKIRSLWKKLFCTKWR